MVVKLRTSNDEAQCVVFPLRDSQLDADFSSAQEVSSILQQADGAKSHFSSRSICRYDDEISSLPDDVPPAISLASSLSELSEDEFSDESSESGDEFPAAWEITSPGKQQVAVSLKSPASLIRSLLLFCCLSSSVLCLRHRWRAKNVANMMGETVSANREAHDMLSLYSWESTLKERDFASLKRRNSLLQMETEELVKTLVNLETAKKWDDAGGERTSLDKALNEDEARWLKVVELASNIQELSRREAAERYGEGPHFVRFELDFAAEEDAKGDVAVPSSFVIKLAPLHLMPHSVYLFLEMIQRGLWDGCSFNIKAPHLLKASPFPYAANSGEDKEKPFIDAGLSSPSFPEYSEEYPHKKYTLGFVGNPNAQGFFINTMDNTAIHGPGAQRHHKMMGGGDPCFAEVVEGLDVIELMRNMDTRDGAMMKEPVGIRTAKIVSARTKKSWPSPPWKQ